MKSDKRFGSGAAGTTVKLQSDMIILRVNLAASRFHGILWQDVGINKGPAIEYTKAQYTDSIPHEICIWFVAICSFQPLYQSVWFHVIHLLIIVKAASLVHC